MNFKNKPAAPADQALAEPSAGGSYLRNADGSLTLVERTEPVHGRVQASREALAQRMGEGAQPAAASLNTDQE